MTDTSSDHQPRIAVIGTEGSGKTVLVATLAKRFSVTSKDGFFLSPIDNTTHRYVERMWLILNQGDWPPSTPAGQVIELKWRLLCNGSVPFECQVRLIDCAGQDLRRIFADDDSVEVDPAAPRHLRELAEYLHSAEIVICLVNLKDFLGEGDPERRLDNEVVLMSALRRLSATRDRNCRLYLLFTQIDQYRGFRAEYGGWPGVVKKFLPYVHGEHVARELVQVGAVAAVNDTQVSRDLDGTPRRVPRPGFESKGLDDLIRNIAQAAREIRVSRTAQPHAVSGKSAPVATDGTAEEEWLNSARLAVLRNLLGDYKLPILAAGFLACFLLCTGSFSGAKARQWPLPVPAPVIATGIEYGTRVIGSDDISLRNSSNVTLRNFRCQLEVTRYGKSHMRLPVLKSVFVADDTHVLKGVMAIPVNSGAVTVTNVIASPVEGTWGVSDGWLWDTVWVRNESNRIAHDVAVRIRATSSSGATKDIVLSKAQLGPGKEIRVNGQFPKRDVLSASIEGWRD